MRKLVILVLFIGLIGSLSSFKTSNNVVSKPFMSVSQSDTLSDSTLYNSYLVHYKRGLTQSLQYPADWNVYEMIGPMWSRKVVKIDTIQTNVFYNELN